MPGLTFRSNLRRIVFWGALGVMMAASVVGMVWGVIERGWGAGPQAAVTVGLGALMVAVVFGLLELVNPTFHPESHLFSWSDVDQLRDLSRRTTDPAVRDWSRSLADRIAVVLPGRSSPPQIEPIAKPPRARK